MNSVIVTKLGTDKPWHKEYIFFLFQLKKCLWHLILYFQVFLVYRFQECFFYKETASLLSYQLNCLTKLSTKLWVIFAFLGVEVAQETKVNQINRHENYLNGACSRQANNKIISFNNL